MSEIVFCPIFHREISVDECLDYAISAQGFGCASSVQQMEQENKDYQTICFRCQHHPIME